MSTHLEQTQSCENLQKHVGHHVDSSTVWSVVITGI